LIIFDAAKFLERLFKKIF